MPRDIGSLTSSTLYGDIKNIDQRVRNLELDLGGDIETGGLLAEYFGNITFDGTLLERNIKTRLNFTNYIPGQTDIAVPPYSVRFSGWILPQFTETYTFYVNSDDGTRLKINDVIVIDNLIDNPIAEVTGSISMVAGVWTPILLEHYTNGTDERLLVEWSSDSLSRGEIPSIRMSWSVGGGAGGTSLGDAGGDVTGPFENLQIVPDAVGIPELSATGSPNNTTFLRGDNTWSEPASGEPGTPVYCIAGLSETGDISLFAAGDTVPATYALFPIKHIEQQSGGFSTSGNGDLWLSNDPGFDWKLNVPEAGWYEVSIQFNYSELYFSDPVSYGEVAHWLYAGDGGVGGPDDGPLAGQDYILHQRPFFQSTSDDYGSFDDIDFENSPFDDNAQVQISGTLYLSPDDPLHVEGQYRAVSLGGGGEKHADPEPTIDARSMVIKLRKVDTGNVTNITNVDAHVIQDEGTPLTQRSNLNFVGDGVVATDDAGNDATVVTIDGGGGGSSIYLRATWCGGSFTEADFDGSDSTYEKLITFEGPSTVEQSGGFIFADHPDAVSIDWDTITVIPANHTLHTIEVPEDGIYTVVINYYLKASFNAACDYIEVWTTIQPDSNNTTVWFYGHLDDYTFSPPGRAITQSFTVELFAGDPFWITVNPDCTNFDGSSPGAQDQIRLSDASITVFK